MNPKENFVAEELEFELDEFETKFLAAATKAARAEVESHLRAGRTLTGTQDGKFIKLVPEDLERFIDSEQIKPELSERTIKLIAAFAEATQEDEDLEKIPNARVQK